MKNLLRNTTVLLFAVFMSISGFSQEYFLTIQGTISDIDGNSVENQEVFINTLGGTTDSLIFEPNVIAVTDATGNYNATLSLFDPFATIVIDVFPYTCQESYSQLVIATGNPNGEEMIFADFVICNESNGGGETNPTDSCYTYFYSYPAIEAPFVMNFETGFGDTPPAFATFSWDFGDNSFSSEPNPSHAYNAPGEYIVTLLVDYSDGSCDILTYTETVFVEQGGTWEECFADFYFFEETENLNSVQFIDASFSQQPATSWSWEFGDGNTSTEQNPIHTYAEGGEYVVMLTTISNNCVSTTEYMIWVGENVWYPEDCQALFYTNYDASDYLTAQFEDISFGGVSVTPNDDNGVLAWAWDFGDGTTSTEQSPTHTYAAPGEYIVSLTIFSESCTSTFEEFVFMEDWNGDGNWADCQAMFFPGFDETLSVQFFDLSLPEASLWFWDFGDGNTSNEQNPIHTFAQAGLYTVMLTTVSGDCQSTFMMDIQIIEEAPENRSVSYAGHIRRAYAVHNNETVGLESVEKTALFSVFPVPAQDVLNFTTNAKTQVTILNVTGQVVKKAVVENNKLDISNLKSGTYFIKLTANNHTEMLKFSK